MVIQYDHARTLEEILQEKKEESNGVGGHTSLKQSSGNMAVSNGNSRIRAVLLSSLEGTFDNPNTSLIPSEAPPFATFPTWYARVHIYITGILQRDIVSRWDD